MTTLLITLAIIAAGSATAAAGCSSAVTYPHGDGARSQVRNNKKAATQ